MSPESTDRQRATTAWDDTGLAHPLVVVLGPTASGKTALSVALAERFKGEIVNCDSVAIYRDLVIGSAKPSAQERSRAPHHMLDLVAPDEPFTAGDYARLARKVLRDIAQRNCLLIVTGGTGLYLRALLEGLFPGPQRCERLRERLRDKARQKGSAHLHKLLARLDRQSAATIHSNDEPKLIRALEVRLLTKRPMSELWQHGREPLHGFRILRLGLNPERDALYNRINARAKWMFDAGLVEETRELLARYAKDERPAVLNSLGYRQAAQLLDGEMTREEAIAATQQGHRNYAKRQITWFRREPEVQWLAGFGDDEEIQQECLQRVARFLSEQRCR